MTTEPCCDCAKLGSIAVDIEVARRLGLDPREFPSNAANDMKESKA